ncbi:MAG: VOC family protein [Methylobacteriaceae bacterium]|nr:VOC family protein [Methylobacteriaceae bacterium]
MPSITHVLETSLYAEKLAATARFYEDVLGLAVMLRSPRLVALDAGRHSVLLVFQRGMSEEDSHTDEGSIPGHDGRGRLHVAFGIPADALSDWRTRLAEAGIAIIAETHWRRGGTSLYFHDPDSHVVELATPGLWANY